MEKDPTAMRFKFLKQLIPLILHFFYQSLSVVLMSGLHKHEVIDQISPLSIAWQGRKYW